MYDSDMLRSFSVFVVSYLGFPVMCKLKLQTWISLSSTESEYIALIKALCNTITIIDIIKETKELGYKVGTVSPNFLCKLFEDNSWELTWAIAPPMRPITKHINVKYCHLRSTSGYDNTTI